jgi:uncharacterized membrane protein YbhN (UPF0104 family)
MHVFRLTARVRAWQNILKAAYPADLIRFVDVFCAYWAGVGVNALTPARGGDVVKLYIAKHRVKQGTTYPTLASSLLVETIFDLGVGICMLFAATQLGLLPGLPDLPKLPAFDWSYAVAHPRVAAAFGVALLVAIALLTVWATRHVVAFKQRVKLGFSILNDLHAYLTQVVSWQALSWGFRIASVSFFLRAFHIPVNWETVLTVLVVGAVATTLPITPGGLGTTQAVLVFALAGWASASAVLSFSVGMQLSTVVVNVVIGFGSIAATLGTLRWKDRARRDGAMGRGPASQPSQTAPPD